MRIAVLGATGHVAKCMIHVFAEDPKTEFYLFSRSESKLETLKTAMGLTKAHCLGSYEHFEDFEYDVILNGVGVWDTPGADAKQIFGATEQYDNLIIHYQSAHPDTKSIHVSSGAVYGGSFASPVDQSSESVIAINAIQKGDYYTAAKLNSEVKHRAHHDLNIVDLRLFGFFSRYMSLQYNYLLSGMINSVKKGTVFEAVTVNFYRDYIHLDDFSRLLFGIVEQPHINTAIDVRSREPISKDDLLELFIEKYGLKVCRTLGTASRSLTGIKPYYFSTQPNEIYSPSFTSRETIESELPFFLQPESSTIPTNNLKSVHAI